MARACSLVHRKRRRKRQPILPYSGRRVRRRLRITISSGRFFLSPLANVKVWHGALAPLSSTDLLESFIFHLARSHDSP